MDINKPLHLEGVKEISCDVETYGLKFEDELFSVQISLDNGREYYFNLKSYKDAPWLGTVTPNQLKEMLAPLATYTGIVYIANASFDTQKLSFFNIHTPLATIFCTHTVERLFFPGENPKLSEYAPRYRQEKLGTVEDHIKQHDLYDPKTSYLGVTIPKKPRYDLVPWNVMSEYAMRDAQVTLKIGQAQRAKLKDTTLHKTTLGLTKALHSIREFGVKLDVPYCEKMFKHHKEICFDILNTQKEGFGDGKLFLTKLYKEHGLQITYNQKTKEPIFNNEELKKHEAIPEVAAILKYRDHYKLYRSFYFNLLYYSYKGRLHVDLNPCRTRTSRFSTTKPALQTLPSKNTEVKQALIPDEGTFFLELDYSGMELRLAFDLAGEAVAVKNMNQGLDMHQQTANKIGISRSEAKTVVFAILYGSGIKRIADQINTTYLRAKNIKYNLFKQYPKLKQLDEKLKAQAKAHGYIRNYYKRLLEIPSDKTYKALNAYIQSTGADVLRIAILETHKYIKENNLKSRIVLSVHDSLLFQIPFSETQHQEKFKQIMESAYLSKSGMKMSCDAKHSTKSYGDLVNGIYKEN